MATITNRKEKTHSLLIQVPKKFREELVEHYEERKSYNSYAEMYRHLIKVGLEVMKNDRHAAASSQ